MMTEESTTRAMRTPRFGWLVAATACGVLLGRGIGLAIAQPGGLDYEYVIALCTLSGGALAAVVAILGEIALFRFRFTVSQMLELFIVCAILMCLWQIYDVHVTEYNANLDNIREHSEL